MSSAIFVLRGQDEVTGTLSAVGVKLGEVTDKIQGMSTATEKSTDSVLKVASGFQGLANVGFSVYNSIDRIETSQYSLEKAHLAVKRATESVEDAQNTYNKTVEKYGEDSAEAKDAADKLTIAQDTLKLANDKVGMAQNNVNSSMIAAAMTVIPSLITIIGSVTGITKAWEGAQAAMNVIMNANPILLVVTAIGLLIAGLIGAYTYCEPFRNAVDAIFAALSKFWNDVLVPVAAWISDVFIGAWQGLVDFYNRILKPIIDTVGGWFTDVWDNVLAPLGKFLEDTLLGAWQTLGNGLKTVYETFIKPVFDALSWVYNNVLKPIGDFFGGIGSALGGIGSAISSIGGTTTVVPRSGGAMAHGQMGGIIDRPTMLIAGEAGPEALIPLGNLGSGISSPTHPPLIFEETVAPIINVEIYGPMVNIQGSADIRTAKLAADMVRNSLKNVVIEASSIAAGETHKTIRLDTSSLSSVGAGASSVLAAPKFTLSDKFREFSEKFY